MDILVEVSVTDSGIGIPPGSLERLFQPFSQADASTTRRYGGTGLGLVIAKTLVELMGGKIAVESQEGHGARFAFTLRLPKQATAWTPERSSEFMAGLRLLAVTPNARVARSLSENLHASGVSVDVASSSMDALSAMGRAAEIRQGYHAIIVDDTLEEMTPHALSVRLRALPGFSTIPMILLCGISRCRHEDGAGRDGFEARISKPAKRAALIKELGKVFLGERTIQAAQERGESRLRFRETGRKLRVLIVDDNEINRKLAKILVEQRGGETDTAEDGSQAVAACAKNAYDLILMDAHMPIMDGVEATLRIREAEDGRHALIIALTANAMSGDRERYLAAGMDEYLTKPINEMAFVAVLHKLGLMVPAPDGEPMPLAQTQHDTDDRAPLPVLDPRLGVELSFGDRETWRTILHMLFDELPRYADTLACAASARDMNMLCETAHKLAGASSYCGTPALNYQAKQVERFAKTGDIDSAAKSVVALSKQIELLLALREDEKFPDGVQPVD